MAKASCKATEEIKSMAKQAIAVQDASNAVGVSGLLNRTMIALSKDPQSTGSDWVAQHPITITILNKMEHLARMSQGRSNAFFRCHDLSEGTDIEFDILDEAE